MHIVELTSDWTLTSTGDDSEVPGEIRGKSFPCILPSCVHTVLMSQGAIPDLYLADNAHKFGWIGRSDWQYGCTFEVPESAFRFRQKLLHLSMIDTVATVELNGREIAHTFNQHREYWIDVGQLLARGRNTLVVTFRSPVKYAFEMEQRLGRLPYIDNVAGVPFNMIRKMACNFGWDWGPQVPTAGIYLPIRLICSDQPVLRGIRTHLNWIDDSIAAVAVDVDSTAAPDELAISILDAEGAVVASSNAKSGSTLDIRSPKRWWPAGEGEQYLYTVRVDNGEARIERRIGLRTVELDTSVDEIGRRFAFRINGREIFCRGANWIPNDCFLDRAMISWRVRRRIRHALHGRMNMLRVWGGGIYETDDFYDCCDEMGMMVWQDFAFACAAYPEEEPLRSEVLAEARDNVARLQHHPSLVLWNGCNENIWGYHQWGWKSSGACKGRTWGEGYYFDLLPKVVAELDPKRPYWPGSPWSGDRDVENGLDPNLDTHGNKHIWEVPAALYPAYRKFAPRFASEFGMQAPACDRTLNRVIPVDERRFDSPSMLIHQRAGWGHEQNQRHLEHYFGEVPDFEDQCYLMQVNQARAIQTAIEYWRTRGRRCMGTLVWQLNDCWPVVSWSAIDFGGRRKLLWYAMRSAFDERLITIQPDGEKWTNGDPLYVCVENDSDIPWKGAIHVHLTDIEDCEIRWEEFLELSLGPRSSTRYRIDQKFTNPARQVLVADLDWRRATWYALEDKYLEYPKPMINLRVPLGMISSKSLFLEVEGVTFVRDVCLMADKLGSRVNTSHQLMTLFPRESALVRLAGVKNPWDFEQLRTPRFLRCVNQFGVTRRSTLDSLEPPSRFG